MVLDTLETALMSPDDSVIIPIFMQLGGKIIKFKGFLDTGASLTVFSIPFINKIKIPIQDVRKPFSITTGNGKIMVNKAVQPYIVDADSDNDPKATIFKWTVFTVPNIPYDIIIGRDLMKKLRYRIIKLEREKAMLENKLKVTRSGAPTSIKSLCIDYYFLDDCKLAKESKSVMLEAIEEETETKEEESDAEMLSDI